MNKILQSKNCNIISKNRFLNISLAINELESIQFLINLINFLLLNQINTEKNHYNIDKTSYSFYFLIRPT